ncbi:carboxypeptidase regulatory-like domain-containing protein [Mucilaginibacter sp. UYCu711]|uniref:carboxypeptidase regulatory-like domain-containing protein n=1 Tax=Mucilaginibacter sp. UYCu711 TaxID=3156339 RepID=UPI003D20F4A1
MASTRIFAQARYDVSGTVINEKGEPLKSATVFIGGSERVMPTDDNGHFKFTNIAQGTFQVSVQMVGYEPLTRNIMVQSGPVSVEMQLKTKEIRLSEVVIGRSNFDNNFRVFSENFLGTSANAAQCVIINPKVLNFTTRRRLLLAEADDFLIIENKRLGYRIHYQLKDFVHSATEGSTLYHGEYSFEELNGTDDQKKEWAKHRLETYQGSLMHFLRSVFQKNTLESGFIVRPLYGYGTERINPDIEDPYKVIIKDRPVMFDSLLTPIGTGFMSFKFNQLYIVYDPQKAAGYTGSKSDEKKQIIKANNSSMLKLGSAEAIIDQKGSSTDYNNFFVRGTWAVKRVADQLPVEYQPPFIPASKRDTTTDKLMATLQQWADSIPQEKMYLHFDKPYYAINDTIWFKGYLTTASRHQLSAISGAAYVDLIDGQNHPLKTLKLPVNSGTIAGNFILGDEIKKGSYHIRAYTQWMRNAGPDYFFDHTFTVGNPNDVKLKADPKTTLQQTDVQFFPESGSLVNGIASKVAFKAVGSDGLGANITGKITDNDNNEIAQIATLHAGMGNYLLQPLTGKTYKANITFTDGTTKSIALPTALNEGYVLSVFQPNKDSVLVRIHASSAMQQSTVNLIIHSSGEIIFASPIKITDGVTSLWLDKRGFPSGIAQFTIFDSNSQPLNERIAFIKSNDQLKLSIDSANTISKSKAHVQFNLKVADSENRLAESTLSVAVIHEDKMPVDESAESTIFSNILLTSDLKGYIEKPNYYFTADTDEVNRALDNLMLTQGFRRFEWKTLNTTVNTKPTFEAEGLGSSISGLVTTLTHKPLPNAKVKLFAVRAALMKDTITDANGRFKFDKMFIGDSLKFTLQAQTADNSDKVIIILDTVAQMSSQVTLRNNKNTADADIIKTLLQKATDEGKPVELSGLHVLKQVDIKASKIAAPKIEILPQAIFTIPEQSVDKIITIPDPEHYNNLTMFLQSSLQGTSIQVDEAGRKLLVDMRPANVPPNIAPVSPFTNATSEEPIDKYLGKEIGLIVNGRKIKGRSEADEILEGSILAGDIAKIEVVRTNTALVNSLRNMGDRFVGFVLLFTKTGDWRKGYNPSIANVIPKGFNKVRKFYSPRYENPETAKSIPDFRTTIYWNPYVGVDTTGKASFEFFNADGPANYRVVIEGINAAGEIGRKVYTYKVE